MNRTFKVTLLLFAALFVAFIGWRLAANQLAASYLEGRFHVDIETVEHLLPIAEQLRESDSDAAREVEDLLDLRAVSGAVSVDPDYLDASRRRVLLKYIAFRQSYPTQNTVTSASTAKAITRYEYLLNEQRE